MSLLQGFVFLSLNALKPLGRKRKFMQTCLSSNDMNLFKLIGRNWNNEIHFYRLQDDQPLVLTHQNFLPTLRQNDCELLDANIVNTTLLKIPLVNLLPSQLFSFAHHAIVIIETESHYLSIDKTTTVIRLYQQLKDLDENASHPLAKYSAKGEKVHFTATTQHTTVCDLITYLLTCQSFRKNYNILFSNCQHFARQILQGLVANPQDYKPFPQNILDISLKNVSSNLNSDLGEN